jgi:uncharacterized protein (DUF2267 family)
VTEILTTPPATDTAAANLVLIRMALPGTKPVAPSAVRRDVGKLLDSELSATDFDQLRNELASAGFLAKGTRNTFVLTDLGRERALRVLGVAELPARTNWSNVIAKYLVPRAAELSSDAAEKLNNGDKLAAFVLKRKYAISGGAGSTVNQVLEAIVCKHLGFPHETTLDGLLRAVLNQVIGTENLPKDQLAKQLPLFETGLKSTKAEAVRCKMVADWLGGQRRAPQPPAQPEPRRLEHEPFDLPTFAATVRKLAADSPREDRFHDNKVFIAALWRASQREPSFPRVSLDEFKQRLVEANSQNLLRLSRADLVQAMEPQLVADSEALYLNATFHFVLLESDHP